MPVLGLSGTRKTVGAPAGVDPAQAAKVARAGAQDRRREAEGQSWVCSAQREGEGKISLLPGEKVHRRWGQALLGGTQWEDKRHQLEQAKFSLVRKNNFITMWG